MATVFIGVGSNLGDREVCLRNALTLLKNVSRITFEKISNIYETEPEGNVPQGKFLNAVWKVNTDLSPEELLSELQRIESTLGRKRDIIYGPRTIDCDILFYDSIICRSQSLTIPHPRLHKRYFVLKPFCDLDPDFIHPVLKCTVRELLDGIAAVKK